MMAPLFLFRNAPSTSGTSWFLAVLFFSFARPLFAAKLPAALAAGGMQLFEDALGASWPESSYTPAGEALAGAGALALASTLASSLRRTGSGSERERPAAEKDAGAAEGQIRSDSSRQAFPDANLTDEYEHLMEAHEELIGSYHSRTCVDYEDQELDHLLAGERITAAVHEYESAMDSEYSRYFDQMFTA
mmetsp:Transcript_118091/g.345894  ORF Transcript_118091/g.345894 Transcript_118091/m.345894 type:complete len:190 (-) Transcript_118091:199-768(-)